MKQQQISDLLTFHVGRLTEFLNAELKLWQAYGFRSRLDEKNNVILTFNVVGYSINQIQIVTDWRQGIYVISFSFVEHGVNETVATWIATKNELKSFLSKIRYFKHG